MSEPQIQEQQQQQQQNGGAGAAEWAISRAGGIGEQHSVSQNDNTIALKGGRRRPRKHTGGRKSKKCGKRGGKSRKNTSRRRRGTRRH